MGHHDLFFKKTFSIRENAADFLQHTLAPELIEEMELDTLTIETGSHVDTSLAENFSDTVYTCRLSGTRIKTALLFEHKSAPDKHLPFQLHRYMANLWCNSINTDKLVQSVAGISEKGGDIAMTTAEKLRQEGIQKGIQKGRQEGSYNAMVTMVRNAKENGLSDEMIARITNLDITLVRKILNNEPVDIPLHLLQGTD